jgi:acyl carrier protein
MSENIESRLRAIVVKLLEYDNCSIGKPEKTLKQLGFDSLHRVELACDLDDEFCIYITDEEAENLMTYGDVLALVKSKMIASQLYVVS